ncbi:MAG: tetratricopeptide repeat protein [Limisphaerales bacterium]
MTRLLLALGFVSAFSVSTWLQPRFAEMQKNPNASDSALGILMGESGRLFANHFLLKADAYFHSGTYPSIFGNITNKEPVAIVGEAHGDHDHDADHGHEGTGEHHEEESIYGKPHDWIEWLGHSFIPTIHTHLDKPGEAREIMPWLKLSADLDPQKITTYVAASYWLRHDPKHADEAEPFLRQGLRANPDSYEILLELGKYYNENKKDSARARNVWELAWAKWQKQKAADKKPDDLIGAEILGELVKEARASGNIQRQIQYLELLKGFGFEAESVQKQIDLLKAGAK